MWTMYGALIMSSLYTCIKWHQVTMELPELAMSQKGIKALCCRPFVLTEVDSYGHAQDSRKSCWPRALGATSPPPTVHERGNPLLSSPSCRVTGRMLTMFSLVTMPLHYTQSRASCHVWPSTVSLSSIFRGVFRRVLRSQRLHSDQFAQNLLENEHSKFQ